MKEILLTGGRPTGKLHLGHYTGAFKSLCELQQQYDNYVILSDIHMLTTAPQKNAINKIWNNAIDMVIDIIAMGVDPSHTSFYLQSNIPEMPYIYILIQNLIDEGRVGKTPSLQEMKKNANNAYLSLGLLAYPVMEAADIISMQADLITVGKDNIDHVDITNEIVTVLQKEYSIKFKKPRYITTENNYILGIDGKNKMSKSLNNCIYISDTSDVIRDKILQMPWTNDLNNIVLEYLKIFAHDLYAKEEYEEQAEQIDEAVCKRQLTEVLVDIMGEMNQRVTPYAKDKSDIIDMILSGTKKSRERASSTLDLLKHGMGYDERYSIFKF